MASAIKRNQNKAFEAFDINMSGSGSSAPCKRNRMALAKLRKFKLHVLGASTHTFGTEITCSGSQRCAFKCRQKILATSLKSERHFLEASRHLRDRSCGGCFSGSSSTSANPSLEAAVRCSEYRKHTHNKGW